MLLSRSLVRLTVAFMLCLAVTLAAPRIAAAAPMLSINPDPGNIFGYIPLDAFGGTGVSPVGAEGLVTLTVPNFVFAGETWTSLSFAENGFAIVGGGSDGTSANQTLPDPAGPNNVLAPFWTDLTGVDILTNVLTDGVGDWLVAEWRGTVVANGATPRFQVWIGLNGAEDVTFGYDFASMPSSVGVTIGAEDKTGQFGATLSGPLVADLRVTSQDLPAAVPEPALLTLLLAGTAIAASRRRQARRS